MGKVTFCTMKGMDTRIIQKLTELNAAFYRDNAASFASTRQHAWPGWVRVSECLPACPGTVLDVACGNARFKTFLDERYGPGHVSYHAVDSCPGLLPRGLEAQFQCVDIVSGLVDGTFPASLEAPECDLTACFGFMHHVPSNRLRNKLLDALIDKTVRGGIVSISLWQFANDSKMLAKARLTTERGCAELGIELEEGDYLLGWNEKPGVYRYCHSFEDSELDDFVRHCSGRAVLKDRFSADGRSGAMNAYLVFERL